MCRLRFGPSGSLVSGYRGDLRTFLPNYSLWPRFFFFWHSYLTCSSRTSGTGSGNAWVSRFPWSLVLFKASYLNVSNRCFLHSARQPRKEKKLGTNSHISDESYGGSPSEQAAAAARSSREQNARQNSIQCAEPFETT